MKADAEAAEAVRVRRADGFILVVGCVLRVSVDGV